MQHLGNEIINQSFFNWELIIVDDNSNSQTKKILKKYSKIKKIKIFFLKRNRGDGYCRLYGVKKARSNIIAFIDSDDIWKKNKLKLQYNFMKNYNILENNLVINHFSLWCFMIKL